MFFLWKRPARASLARRRWRGLRCAGCAPRCGWCGKVPAASLATWAPWGRPVPSVPEHRRRQSHGGMGEGAGEEPRICFASAFVSRDACAWCASG